MKNRKISKNLLRFAGLVAGVCLVVGTQAQAQTPPGVPPLPPSSSSPGEEVTSLPFLEGQEGGGFRFTGDPVSLQELILSVDGRGTLEIKKGLVDGTFELLFQGSYQFELDPALLQSGRVEVAFQVRTLREGGFGSFGFFGAQPTQFGLDHLWGGMDLPLAMFAGQPEFHGHGFQIGALHPEAGYVFGTCQFALDRITLTQVGGAF